MFLPSTQTRGPSKVVHLANESGREEGVLFGSGFLLDEHVHCTLGFLVLLETPLNLDVVFHQHILCRRPREPSDGRKTKDGIAGFPEELNRSRVTGIAGTWIESGRISSISVSIAQVQVNG